MFWPFLPKTSVAFSTALSPEVAVATLKATVVRFAVFREVIAGRVNPARVVLFRFRPGLWSPCAPVFRGRLLPAGSGSTLEGTFSPSLFGIFYAFFPLPFIFAFAIGVAASPPETVHPDKLFFFGGLFVVAAFWFALLAVARWVVRNDVAVVSKFIETTLNARGA